MHPTTTGRQGGRFTVAIHEGHRRHALTESSFAAAASRAIEAAADAQDEGRHVVALVVCGGVVWFRVTSDGDLWAADADQLAPVGL